MIPLAATMLLSTIWVEASALDGQWHGAPARFEADETVNTARVTDESTGVQLPCKVQQHRDKRYVFWVRSDDGTTAHRYRIDQNEENKLPPPVFVGAGDMMDYGRSGATADLGVGLWATALPIDWDEDGDLDLIYTCHDVPQGGAYLYLQVRTNLFQLAQRLGDGLSHPALADMNGDGKVDLLARTWWYDDIRTNGLAKRVEGPLKEPEEKSRSFMARQVDWDGDGLLDLVSAAGVWTEYGWDRGFDEAGNWTRGPLHGPVWFNKNTGTNEAPVYAPPVPLEADDKAIDIYGAPCPCIADWDGDGDLDILCGEFRDEFTFFENMGGPASPRLAAPRPVMGRTGPLRIDLCMMSPTVCDWNGDGRVDLIVGQEDGRASVLLNRGFSYGVPQFGAEDFLKEITPPIKSGVLVTPWLDEETGDLICGNSAGYFEWFHWFKDSYQNGKYVSIATTPVRVQAGYNGSVQGPAEEKWGYTVPSLGDLDGDGVTEIVYNSIIGRIERIRFAERRDHAIPPEPVIVNWSGDPPYPAWNWWKPGATDLAVQWRTRPVVLDWDKDGVEDLIAVDHEGYLAFYRNVEGTLEPGSRVFLDEAGQPLRLNAKEGGGSGRAKFDLADWDGDGDLDIIRNTESAGWFENDGQDKFAWRGDFPLRKLAGHTTAPQVVDWNSDGTLDLILGAEDGHIYCYHRAAIDEPERIDAVAAQ